MELVVVQQGSQDWLDARAGAITASRFRDAISRTGGLDEKQAAYVAGIQSGLSAAAAAAAAGYKAKPTGAWVDRALSGERMDSPSAVALDYACLIACERIALRPLDEAFVTWAMRRGQELEPEARHHYEVNTGRIVIESGIALTDDRLFGYSTDGLLEDEAEPAGHREGLLEIKCPSAPGKIVDVWTAPDRVVGEYLDQIDGGLWITGRAWCDLVIYTPWLRAAGKTMFVRRIYRDEDRIAALEEKLWDFARLMRGIEARLRVPVDQAGKEPPLELAVQTMTDVITHVPTPMTPAAPLTGTINPADLF